MRKLCKVDQCLKISVAHGLCDRHYRRLRKYGDLSETHYTLIACSQCKENFEWPIRNGKKIYCSSACQRKAYQHRLGPCQVDGCDRLIVNRKTNLCSMHYERLKNNGSVEILRRKPAKNVKCSIEECDRLSIARQLCTQHYQMWQKHGDPKGGKFRQKVRKAKNHPDGTRTCSECEVRQPLKNFHRDKLSSDGYRSKCKKCRISHVKQWYQADIGKRRAVAKARYVRDIDKIREKDNERYLRDREKRIVLATEHSHLRKTRKKKVRSERGISRLSLKRLHGTKCYYCKSEMDFSVAKGKKWRPNMATIEHLIPIARGGEHTFENTVLACRRCNISKNSKLESEFRDQNPSY